MPTDEEWIVVLEKMTQNWGEATRALHGAVLWYGTDAALLEAERANKEVRRLEAELEAAKAKLEGAVANADRFREAMNVIAGGYDARLGRALEVRREQGWQPHIQFRLAAASLGNEHKQPQLTVFVPASAAEKWSAKRKEDAERMEKVLAVDPVFGRPMKAIDK